MLTVSEGQRLFYIFNLVKSAFNFRIDFILLKYYESFIMLEVNAIFEEKMVLNPFLDKVKKWKKEGGI